MARNAQLLLLALVAIAFAVLAYIALEVRSMSHQVTIAASADEGTGTFGGGTFKLRNDEGHEVVVEVKIEMFKSELSDPARWTARQATAIDEQLGLFIKRGYHQ